MMAVKGFYGLFIWYKVLNFAQFILNYHFPISEYNSALLVEWLQHNESTSMVEIFVQFVNPSV